MIKTKYRYKFRRIIAMVSFVLAGIPLCAEAQRLQKSNPSIIITPNDTEADIIRKAAQVTPTAAQLRWQKLELTAFIHFGINTFTNREWGDGKEDPKAFNPTALDARQWARVCKEAGIKQIILTAKHHDGFCLWPTKTTAHSVKSSPWKDGQGDVVKELAAACSEYGLGFGVYVSPWDRNAPSYGTPAYNDLFVKQLTELLTQYGKIDEVWFDGANGEGPNGKKQVYDFPRWYRVIRDLQPDAVIAVMGPDVRWVGTESGYGRATEWSVVPTNMTSQEQIAAGSQTNEIIKPEIDQMAADIGSREKIKGATKLVWYPAETDVSIRPGWFYHPEEDEKVKSPEKLLDIYFNSVGRNGVLLLNIPPDKRGLIHENDHKNLKEWNQLVSGTFQTNLMKGATFRSNNGKKPKALSDLDYDSYWITQGTDTTATIEINLQGQKTFDVFAIQENISIGQRIEAFVLEYKDSGEWKRITEGTTVGFKRLLRFPTVTADTLRLRITSSRLNPTIAEIGIYKLIE
ncbi:alpha-L-fucosidase [Pedobacter sp.]|uniref:alpha-L-fucosidase n=1 Tax=Pedobacter sp. TaxID=1411316 RepID=UPI003D7F95A2